MIIRNPLTGLPDFLGRYNKPSFGYQSAKSVVVPASDSAPAYYVISGVPYLVNTNLECDLTSSLSSAIAADTIYYLYAALSGGDVVLVADIDPPATGPRNASEWTYIGAFYTNGSSNVEKFSSIRGFTLYSQYVDIVSHTGDTTITQKTLTIPTTAKQSYGIAVLQGITAAFQFGSAMGDNTGSASVNLTTGGEGMASGESQNAGFVPLVEAQTVYLYTNTAANTIQFRLYGWMEDPSEYQ